MTTTEEFDDPYLAHFKREPLPSAGIRVIMLTRKADDRATDVVASLLERIGELGRAVEARMISVDDLGMAEAIRRGLEDAQLPLVLITTAEEPWTAAHLEPLLKAIDSSDHVIGRRSVKNGDDALSWLGWILRRMIFAVPLHDIHSPCRLHRLEKLLAIPLQSQSSFVETEILAKATFLGHLLDEVEVPPLLCHSWNERWWIDASRVLKHPEFEARSCPPEKAQSQHEGHHGPGGEDQHGVSHVVECGSFEDHLAQGTHELGQGQRADEGLERLWKSPGSEEDSGEQPHRQHDQVHQAADGLGGGGTAADEQADPGKSERS
jgi:hypothetical protein